MIQLPKLQKGDKVAIIAPGRSVSKEQLQPTLDYLNQWELEVVFGQYLYEQFCNGYSYAGTKEQRLKDLQWALNHPEIKAIWFAAGGYGAIHLIEHLDLSEFKRHPKWLIGYSDITVFHQFFNTKGIPTIHASVVKPLNHVEYHPETYKSIKKVLFGNNLSYQIQAHLLNVEGKAKGKLLGGNLSILYSLLSSPYQIEHEKFILLIEDWYENWYHVDRMMNALNMSGLLTQLSGVIVGSFTRMDVKEENKEFNTAYDSKSYKIIAEYLHPLNIPISFGFPAGHIGDNRALILGKEIELIINQESSSIKFWL